MGLHHFGLGQHTSAAWKMLKARADQHQIIAGGGAAPSLSDAATLMVPYGFSLLSTLAMKQGSHSRLRVVLVTLFGADHPTELEMNEVNTEITERDTELKECNPRDRGLKARLPESITSWVQMRLLNWFYRHT